MRISDWSSDVCSSDLVQRQRRIDIIFETLGRRNQRLHQVEISFILHRFAQFIEFRLRIMLPAKLFISTFDHLDRQRRAFGVGIDGEIGSASCRESVCQYGEIPVVDGSLKKKKQKI